MSGGVDSAVAALLLRERGADVQALYMTNWDDDDGYCTAAADLQDARAVCDALSIPLHHVNFARQYRERVFEHFLAEYRAGRTPNPDVLCNREIKFGVFRDYAKRLGAERLATGHYARIDEELGAPVLCKGRDANKDQSYFLHAIPTPALCKTVFPLGDLLKQDVRELARDHGLPVSGKKDSTGICFIGERPFREFLENFLPAKPGPICTSDLQTIGEHHGLMYYTLGQRQGLGLGGRRDSPEGAWYVARKDLERNALVVVQDNDPLLYSTSLQVSDVSWLGGPPGEDCGRCADGRICLQRQGSLSTAGSGLPPVPGPGRTAFGSFRRGAARGCPRPVCGFLPRRTLSRWRRYPKHLALRRAKPARPGSRNWQRLRPARQPLPLY